MVRAGFAGRMGPPGGRRRPSFAAYPVLNDAYRAMLAGGPRVKIVSVIDSTTGGSGGGNIKNSYPSQLAGLMARYGAYENNRFSDGSQSPSFDTRISFGAGWAINTQKTLGGYVYQNTTTFNPITFTPNAPFDAVGVSTFNATGFEVKIGDGTPISITGIGGNVTVHEVTCAAAGLPPGNYTVTITPTTATSLFLGVDCYMANAGIDIINGGAAGFSTSEVIGTTVSADKVVAKTGAHLILYKGGINDYNVASPPSEATFKANLQVWVDLAEAIGADLQFVIPNRIGTAFASNEATFHQYIRDVAMANGLRPPLDLIDALGTYAQANAAGLMADQLHPTTLGYAREAQFILNALMAPVADVYDASATALFARMPVSPTYPERNRINALIVALKGYGIWSKLDEKQVMAMAISANASGNFINANFTMTLVNSPTFTAKKGYSGNGSTSYINTNFNPAAGSLNFTQNSCSIMVWCNSTGTASSAVTDVGSFDGANGSIIRCRGASNYVESRLNTGSTSTSNPATVTDAKGMTLISRTGSGGYSVYRDGVLVTSPAVVSAAIANVNIFLGALNTSGTPSQHSNRQYGAFAVGGGLTATEAANYYTAMNTYMTAVGNT
ncbi:SGNH/GDSL hydrolase family protein [Mesorhizobium sp. ASY16-5R]|uniref:SGNH/GDSL hydrolase family protein n=1 Tax=Mesorhizobium sp. ASY16-5R TaxID=3445772 RepID=UPI003F9FBC33